MCMCLARGGVGGEGVSGLCLGFTNPVVTGEVLNVGLYLGCGGLGGEWALTRIYKCPQKLERLNDY